MEKISIEVNANDAGYLLEALMELSDYTSPYYTCDLLKSVSLAITSEDIADDAKLEVLHGFNAFMAMIMLSNEWFNSLYHELKAKINSK
jgi:hypothetical protein